MNTTELVHLNAICDSVAITDAMAEILNVTDEDDNYPLDILNKMLDRGFLSEELTRIFSEARES